MKKISISVSIVLLAGCSLYPVPKLEVGMDPMVIEVQEEAFVCGRDKVKDADGNEYNTAYFDVDGGHDVMKEGQCWMAENLNVGTVILNPDQEPSDDGVIEKWCMTDDWSASYITECDYGGGGGRPEICREREERRTGGIVKSEKNNCDGTAQTIGYGGIYAWSEALKNDVCPLGWTLPSRQDWVELENNVRQGITYENFLNDFPMFIGKREFENKIPVAFYLMQPPFNAFMSGVFQRGKFMRKEIATLFLSENSGPILLEKFSNGNPTLEREVQYVGTFNKNSLKDGYSIRCVKSQNKEDVLSNNQIESVLKEIEKIFSVVGDMPEMQNIPIVPSGISKEQYYSLIYTSLLKFRLLHIYDNFEELVKFQQDEFSKISQNEYVISLLLFQRGEDDSSLEFLMKFFVTIQVQGEKDWIISNIERVNMGQGGMGSMYTKYEEKKTQRDGEKITPLFQLIEKNELQKRLKSFYKTREDDKKTYLESLNQKRPMYLHREEDKFVCGRDKVKDADGNEYKTAYFDVDGGHDVMKDGQCWMAENLNVGTVILNPDQDPSDDGVIEKWCINDAEVYCEGLKGKEKYGGFYSWDEATNYTNSGFLSEKIQGVCPSGWHIPEYKDWLYVKNFFSQFDAGTTDGRPNKMKVKDSYGGFTLGAYGSLYQPLEYFVEGISKRAYFSGIIRTQEGVIPAIFYIGDEYNYFLFRELLIGGAHSVRCVRNFSTEERQNVARDNSEVKNIQDMVRKVIYSLGNDSYIRDEEVLDFFKEDTFFYQWYGFEHFLLGNHDMHIDMYNSDYIDDETYIVVLKKQKYANLEYDFNIGHKYFLILKKYDGIWKIEDILTTKRGDMGDTYTYIGDIQYIEYNFPFLKNIFHFNELLKKQEKLLTSEGDVLNFLE